MPELESELLLGQGGEPRTSRRVCKNQSIFLIFQSIPFQNMLAKVPSFVRFNVTCGQNTDYDLLTHLKEQLRFYENITISTPGPDNRGMAAP